VVGFFTEANRKKGGLMKHLFSLILPSLIALSLSTTTLFSTVIQVPSQYPTIQQGLNAAQSGDTVLVATGTYPENISWPYTDGILLTSEMGADSTIIDGNGAGRVIDFPGTSFSRNTKITGFTIQNGAAEKGAGIFLEGSPYLHHNIISRNIAQGTSTWVYGGGIFCEGDGSPLIEYNYIQGNVTTGEYWNYGAGIYIDWQNSAIVRANIIDGDSCIGGYYNYGAGIYCDGESTPEISHNIIQGNVSYLGDRGHGAGIYVDDDCNAYILSNLIYNNTAQSGSWNYGAGILINNDASIINNTIVGNRCLGGSWAYGGGIYIYDSTNTIGNNIIVDNSANSGGGIYAGTGDHATLLNNDVWNNSGGNYSGIAPGVTDISVDPLFVTGPLGDFYLSQTAAGQGQDSPCIDYGFATAESLGLHTYTTRTDTIPDSGTVDLGYHYPTQYQTAIEEHKDVISKPHLDVFPSPSSSSFHIRFTLQFATDVTIAVFDEVGRLNNTLLTGTLMPGHHDLVWNGTDTKGNTVPSGTYFLIIQTGTEISTSKVIFIQ
jgi:hypothetical protein